MNYFEYLPTITYNNMTAKNILARAILPETIRNNQNVFYPYTMEEGMRPDILSNLYYGSPNYTWLIWHTNNTIDPYFFAPLSDLDFYNHIVAKYGSYETAESTVAHYRNNWYTDNTEYTPSEYNNLTYTYKKYWDPVLDYNLQVKSYRRKPIDTIINTNKIAQLEISYTSNNAITVGEKVKVGTSTWGWCTYSSSNTIQVQHITGQFNSNTTIVGSNSAATGTITSNTIIQTTIAGQDALYWEPVTYLELEQQVNETRKEIKLLDVSYKKEAQSELRRVMRDT